MKLLGKYFLEGGSFPLSTHPPDLKLRLYQEQIPSFKVNDGKAWRHSQTKYKLAQTLM